MHSGTEVRRRRLDWRRGGVGGNAEQNLVARGRLGLVGDADHLAELYGNGDRVLQMHSGQIESRVNATVP